MDSAVTLRKFRNRPVVLVSALALVTAMWMVVLGGRANAAVTAAVAGGVLTVTGDTSANTIIIVCTGGNVKVNPAPGDPTPATACSAIVGIVVNGDDGGDTVDLTGVSSAAGFTNGALNGSIVVNGQNGDDTLLGGPFQEQLNGGDDNDTIDGGLANDTLSGNANGAAGDTISFASAPSGVNVTLPAGPVSGGAGADSINGFENATGSPFNDTINGDGNPNVLKGGDGNDTIKGGDGDDTENGEGGDDIFDEGSAPNGKDTMNGGAGQDLAKYAARTGAVTVTLDNTANDGESGELDNVGADGLVENVTTGSANDTITGNGLANTFNGGLGNDTESGGDGNDTFSEVGASPNGNDILNGDNGVDAADYSSRTAAVTVTLDGNANDGESGETDNVGGTGNTVENVIGGSGNDTLSGNLAANTLTGGPGIDTADYSSATAAVNANLATGIANGTATGTDTLVTMDNLTGSPNNDTLVGDNDANTLTGLAGNDTLDGGLGPDVFNGGDGVDTARYANRVNPVGVTLDGLANDGESGENDNVKVDVENVTGGNANDRLVGSAAVNKLKGGIGNDTLRSLGGNDIVIGGLGDDIVKGGTENDVLRGGGGDDTMIGGPGDDTLRGGGGDDLLKGGPGNDPLFGGPGNDTCLQGSGSGALHSC